MYKSFHQRDQATEWGCQPKMGVRQSRQRDCSVLWDDNTTGGIRVKPVTYIY